MTPYSPNLPPGTAMGLAAELRRIAAVLADLSRRLEAIEATAADHEARLVAIGA